jgi:hypothetical protein
MQSGGGTAHFSGSYGTLTVKCSPGHPSRCTLQSNSIPLLSLVAGSVLGTPGLLPSAQKSPQPFSWLLEMTNDLFQKRKNLDSAAVILKVAHKINQSLILNFLQEELKAKTYWARQVQFGLLTRYRDQTATLLNGMDTLLDEAFLDINELANQMLTYKQVLENDFYLL